MNVKAPRFFGGLVGYFAYDCIYSLFEKVERTKTPDPALADKEYDAMLHADQGLHCDRSPGQELFIFSSPFLTYDSDLSGEYYRSVAKDPDH